jgi:hypothetical protein
MVEEARASPDGSVTRNPAADVSDSLLRDLAQVERPRRPGSGHLVCLPAIPTGPSSNAFIPTGPGVGRPAPGHAPTAPVLAMTSVHEAEGAQGALL